MQRGKQKNIVVIGGGTGTYTVLSGLKKYPVDLTAIVSMADEGGSNRVIRDEFGLLPTSDIRQCLVALAEENGESERLMRDLFIYRFSKGTGIEGMTFGNLFMAALADVLGSQAEAIKKTCQILKIKGKVLPVTLDNVKLGAVYENGQEILGEHLIDEPQHDGALKIAKLFLLPKARANPEALDAILKADLVVLAPGDLYTSLVANLVVEGIREALQKTKANVVYVLNLMTRFGQTHGFGAKDHITVLEKYLGTHCLNTVVINSVPLSREQKRMQKYEEEQSFPVVDDFKQEYFQVMYADIARKEEIQKVPGDVVQRSFIRHDPDQLARQIIKIMEKG